MTVWDFLLCALLALLIMGFVNRPKDPWERCLRDWPLAECQARKDAEALK